MYDEYLYRNGTIGVNKSTINVNAYHVAYPVALNYANNCKLRLTSSNSSGTKFACVVLLFYYKTGKKIDTEE